MTTRAIWWHIWRLALGAGLLWWDTRAFLFYLFTLVLLVSRQINHLRAFSRMSAIDMDCWMTTLCEHLHIPRENVNRIYEMKLAALSDEERKRIADDRTILGV